MKPRNAKLSRRGFGRLLAVTPLAATAAGAPPQAVSREEELKAANERRLTAAQALAKFELPIATEPAFIFRP